MPARKVNLSKAVDGNDLVASISSLSMKNSVQLIQNANKLLCYCEAVANLCIALLVSESRRFRPSKHTKIGLVTGTKGIFQYLLCYERRSCLPSAVCGP